MEHFLFFINFFKKIVFILNTIRVFLSFFRMYLFYHIRPLDSFFDVYQV